MNIKGMSLTDDDDTATDECSYGWIF